MEKKYCQSCGMPLDKPEWLGTRTDKSKSSEYCYYCLKDGEYVVDISMDKMIDIWVKYSKKFNQYSQSQLSKEEVRRLLKERLPRLKRWRQKNETQDIYHQSINKVVSYINEHLFGNPDLKSLSQIANLSEFHFHRIFRAIMNEGTGEYIQRLRLEYVAHKLLTTNLNLTRIVESTSYNSIFALSRAFKKHFGVSPSEYRRQPDSGYLLRNTFSFEVYINTPMEVEPEKLHTDVYIPAEKIETKSVLLN